MRSIAPSSFVSARQCRLREVFGANRVELPLPLSPAALVGSVTHRIFQEAGEGSLGSEGSAAMEKRWSDLIEQVEHKMSKHPLERWLLPLVKSLPDYEVRRIQTVRRALSLEMAARNTEQRSHKNEVRAFGFELPVATVDGLIRGRIDRVMWSAHGRIIQDFKTGNVYDSREKAYRGVRADYEIQLRLYAALYFEVYGEWAATLELVPLQGASVAVSYSRTEAVGLVGEAKDCLRDLNRDLAACDSAEQAAALASPQAEVCSFCAYRPYCAAYQEVLTREIHINDAQWPNDVLGKVVGSKKLGNGMLSIGVQQAGEEIWIRGVSPNIERHPALSSIQIGQSIGIFNLRASRHSGGTPVETSYTTIYTRNC